MKQLRLSQGLFTLVDPEDFDWASQWKWSASQESRRTKWYAVRFDGKKGEARKVRLHRAIMERRGLKIPPGYVVDHLNHNSLDNRFSNLQIVTQQENMRRSEGWKRKGVRRG